MPTLYVDDTINMVNALSQGCSMNKGNHRRAILSRMLTNRDATFGRELDEVDYRNVFGMQFPSLSFSSVAMLSPSVK